MDGDEPVRVGFLGAGLIARYHAMQLARSPEAHRIVAVHDPDATRAEGFVRAHGGDAASGIAQVVDASDAVIVCTPTAQHLDGVREVVDARRAVFCEKPLSVDLRHAGDLAGLVTSAGVVNMTGLVLRSSPAMLAARELVSDPASGRVMNVVFRDDQYLPTQGMYGSTWRGDPDVAGSGVLMEHSIHDVDLLEWLVGPIESVSARQWWFHGIEGIEDSVTAIARFSNGATAALVTVWHDVLSRPSQRRIEIICEHAMVTIEGDVLGPVRSERSDDRLDLVGEDLGGWLGERGIALDSAETVFLRAVGDPSGGQPHPDIGDALRAHVVVDSMYRSATAGGAPVDVPQPFGSS